MTKSKYEELLELCNQHDYIPNLLVRIVDGKKYLVRDTIIGKGKPTIALRHDGDLENLPIDAYISRVVPGEFEELSPTEADALAMDLLRATLIFGHLKTMTYDDLPTVRA